jgi:hypothetical protein
LIHGTFAKGAFCKPVHFFVEGKRARDDLRKRQSLIKDFR